MPPRPTSLLLRRVLYGGAALTSGTLFYDRYIGNQIIIRNSRTIYTMARIITDYKLHFSPEATPEDIEALHTRTASRILSCCRNNGGLYIKFGQVLALNSAILPPPYAAALRVLYDNAPVIPLDQVERIFQEDFGCLPRDLFLHFDPIPIASASIAQVHRATLQGSGEEVAVKVQKPYIQPQMEGDFASYRFVIRMFEYAFEIPMLWTADYTIKHLRQEADFLNEGRNAEAARADLALDPDLAADIYIPTVHWDRTSRRVLTCTWAPGLKMTDTEGIRALGLDPQRVMERVVDLFAFQIFRSGFVHCDPHPGNVLVRPSPTSPTTPQIILIDHGLYMREDPAFRNKYCRFWKALLLNDQTELADIATAWGIADLSVFASATLMRPWSPKSKTPLLIASEAPVGPMMRSHGHFTPPAPRTPLSPEAYRAQLEAKERVAAFLRNTELLPRELILIGRNMNIIRAANKATGSSVNRITIMAEWAVQGLGDSWSLWDGGVDPSRPPPGILSRWGQVIRARWNWWRFRLSIWSISFAFRSINLYQSIRHMLLGGARRGFEEAMDQRVSKAMEQQFGVKVDDDVFAG